MSGCCGKVSFIMLHVSHVFRGSPLAERFSAELPGLSLPQVLSIFDLPRQMVDLKDAVDNEVSALCTVLYREMLS